MTFPLAGLLRVRGAQERIAAEQLSRATADASQAEASEERARSSLAAAGGAVADDVTLLALAAARAAGRSALSDLHTLSELRRAEAERAKAAHVTARRELKGLERLESAHRAAAAQAELHAEQTALDEIGVVQAARDEGSAA
ncbi:hypothetical protein QWJ90_01785 [Microbacterium oryzae]|uniref:hypothetical protein n=1 Tax=Microbacterium oryzae TaxID=743009 RepID=UPI0025B0DBC2|nr:hypothetical protein [Microbacterium oryzae]MDN3309654.1 hypothetical protein [Microbacterium oryzae]